MIRKIVLTVLLLMAVLSTTIVCAKEIEVDFESEKLKEILTKVQNLKQGKIGEILDQFSSKKNWKWTLLEGSLPDHINAATQLTEKGAITVFDYDKLTSATDLSVARTIIHEMVHAHLVLAFYYEPANAKQQYPGMVKAWNTSSDPDYNAIQHQEMCDSFVDDIAMALKEYNETQHIMTDNSVYVDLAWGGLDYQNNTNLNEADKRRIQIRLVSAQLNIAEEEPVQNTGFL